MGELNPPRLLGPEDELEYFSCGSEPLDSWLREKARLATGSNTARVHVVTDGRKVVGYFALAASSTLREELPRSARRDLPRHRIPMILLARLAVATHYQNRGIGSALVSSALEISIRVSEHIGAMGLATNAKDSAARSFYESLGFQPGPNDQSLMIFPLTRMEKMS